ncbi:aldose 1-epimerase family protein [Formosa sp. S-31]|uniref:aldose 1-epimerase family protein n=1 Tax=Formosa sp. S-31 TaxID=2790949 RepID=UPI003EB77712
MYSIQNNLLKIVVNETGAELCEISSVKNSLQFMWDANPNVWGSYAPNLFPVIGSLKNDQVIIEGKPYNIPKHGFTRRNSDVKLVSKSENELVFSLKYNQELLEIYPYKFEFIISFTLKDNRISINHTVKNLDDKTMYFSVGGHPAFKCPLVEGESYSDYYLEFEHNETSESYLINMDNGLIKSESFSIINRNKIDLHYDLFNKDALVFKDLKSRKVSLKSNTSGTILTVDFPGFPFLGIWAKPHADYVCIEPWIGIADSEDHDQDFTKKEGIQTLKAGESFNAVYSIEIDPKHLV